MIATDIPLLSWKPRPDQPERYDQQESFYYSEHPGVTFIVGGNGSGTSETACAKVAKSLIQWIPPPRKDTPFWICGNSYDSITKNIWKEKLSPISGHGHIPLSEIDWEGIRWYKTKEELPFRVPLKPWPEESGGRPDRNWVIEFKSYEQGRSLMQGESIGGFLFVEQFPWEILTEVLRGCREHNIPGLKLAEFTPVDPEQSYNLQEMIENDRLPPGWAVYRANTECAMEAGHISKEWFDEFFGMIPEDMREVRMIGAWATFEGLVYQQFNPLVHLVDDDVVFPDGDFPPNVYHRRGLDWGFGPDNAFCCEFAYRNGIGEWYFYDEYYSTDQAFTVHEHLKAVADMWLWPREHPLYGMTYADPSDLDSIRIASRFSQYHPDYDSFNIGAGVNRVNEGIDHVKTLLQKNPATNRPRLFIHKRNCPNLARQFQTYRWLRASKNSINPRDARGEVLKKDDHAMDSARYLLFSEARRHGTTVEQLAKQHSAASRVVPGAR